MNPQDSSFLSHLDDAGQIRMVDVGAKASTQRVAVCRARVRMSAHAFGLLTGQERGKGEVLNTARVAGVLAAKRCAELIPLCHTLPLSFVGVDFALDDAASLVEITATCRSDYKTGVEMEAMTACSVAALTIYDMCKAADKGIVVEEIRLLYKAGGKSGEWRAPDVQELAQALVGLDAGAGAAAAGAAAGMPAAPAGGQVGPAAAPSAAAPAAAASAAAASSADAPARAGADQPGAAASQGTEQAIAVVYFARIAELTGRRSETFAWQEPLTGAELLRRLAGAYPAVGALSRLELAVNQEHAGPDTVIRAGDEVAVFEPVTGG